MIGCSALVISRKFTHYAVGGLFGVVIAQGFGYGLMFDLVSIFFVRTCA